MLNRLLASLKKVCSVYNSCRQFALESLAFRQQLAMFTPSVKCPWAPPVDRLFWVAADWRLTIFAMLLGTGTLLSGCASLPSVKVPDSYKVKWGDTLYGISWRYGLDYMQVAAWNRLKSPDIIYAGQSLRLAPPPSSSTLGHPSKSHGPTIVKTSSRQSNEIRSVSLAKRIRWHWPVKGKVVRGYNPAIPGRKGIQIRGTLGQPIKAASTGQVVYSGSGLPGYGRLIIVKHSSSLLSAYGHLGKILVKEGDQVKSGQMIAELGPNNENRPVLHFEIRQHGDPINPLRVLPS